MQRAVFLDRDGVVNVEKNYTSKIEDFEFIDSLFDSLKYLQSLGYKLFIITNQSGIARGYYSIDDYKILTNWMIDKLGEEGIVIDQVEFCPHGPEDNCSCRKPKTGMVDNILKKHEIDLENSWLIGDKTADIECAKNAKIKNTIQVKSGHKFDEKTSIADFVCDSIKDIKNIIKT
ncbi:D-glycero-beta-D-manno-heptose 1,7-bisphosphate 7-phosphatase [Halarcobacter ebronensis]|uniref:D,D-heptose 1,7-bisphosphate phosphatase n=1 Tax=Halarcobacter ebronensis TaxID=1462615 RepID=A0A4Q1AJR1_9BACT|nr:D-glycero-beta-D-manno-heptose 1,7-bisphosphate 7-phosphatase [Halarcobacter ebronensis]QKF81398.1 D,D-heptose 1,7-bisphosphate phosphatase [Halarcobacter ebronensis]RXK01842.1 D-glycero-beta-D-manno-heptose-1,7-bisphosphate 7-phosphatase [Halarcobacter ebronensis]